MDKYEKELNACDVSFDADQISNELYVANGSVDLENLHLSDSAKSHMFAAGCPSFTNMDNFYAYLHNNVQYSRAYVVIVPEPSNIVIRNKI